MKEVIVKEVVITKIATGSRLHTVTQVWEKDGTLIATANPLPEPGPDRRFTAEQMIAFTKWINRKFGFMALSDKTRDYVREWINEGEAEHERTY